ncbi:hypothetical protein, partial [Clostridium tarantellae]
MSEKFFLGYITAILGAAIFSLELISLQLLKAIDKSTYRWYESIKEPPIFIAFFITIFIIFLG